MTANLIFSSTVKCESDGLLQTAKYLCHSNHHPSQSIVNIRLEKVKADELTLMCAQIDEMARGPILATIQKAQTKLAFAEKVNTYLSTNSESIDPRVEKLMAKITAMMENLKFQNNYAGFTKLFKMQNKLNNFDKLWPNPKTLEELLKARTMLCEIYRLVFSTPTPTGQTPVALPSAIPSFPVLKLFDSNPTSAPCEPGAPILISALDPQALENEEEEEEELDDAGKLGKICPALASLHNAAQWFQWRGRAEYFGGLSCLDELKNVKWQDSECTVQDRVFFHLYLIQNIETPDKVDRNDRNWGMKAFETEELSTAEQRLRAVLRTQVELLLHLLEKEIREDNSKFDGAGGENFDRLLDALEGLNLSPSDVPSGQNSVTTPLFTKFCQTYAKAREGHPSWLDPNRVRDFGRRAFSGHIANIELSLKTIEVRRRASADARVENYVAHLKEDIWP